jgi:hypothetical protein
VDVSAGVQLAMQGGKGVAITGPEVQVSATKAVVKTASDMSIQTGGEFNVKSARNIVLKGANRILQN